MSDNNQTDFGHAQFTPPAAWEFALLALLVWREARNQTFQGMLAVAWSVRNRVMHSPAAWWGHTWAGVILKPYQYSSFNHDNPEVGLLPVEPADAVFAQCLMAAQRAYLNMNPELNPIGLATHYYAPKSVKTEPEWRATATFVATIGDHDFYIAK
jgi:spore germination cell wall hydrolase CwlJ-like protein